MARQWLCGLIAGSLLLAGCATPEYSLHQTPTPEESAGALQIERSISAEQAKEFEQQQARPLSAFERPGGLDIQTLVGRLSRVTERPNLSYRAYLYRSQDPNAAALADGRIYISNGMFAYLKSRGSRPDELAFILGHELAHTVAQHLVKRYRALEQQQLLMGLIAAGASALTRNAGAGAQQAGQLALDAASIVQDVRNSGFSQEQELEADQLGIRYAIKAGYDPRAALDLLEDFQRFDSASPLLRTHPYMSLRRSYLQRYLEESGQLSPPGLPSRALPLMPPLPASSTAASPTAAARAARQHELQETQKLYPKDSVSWQNLQRQIDELDR